MCIQVYNVRYMPIMGNVQKSFKDSELEREYGEKEYPRLWPEECKYIQVAQKRESLYKRWKTKTQKTNRKARSVCQRCQEEGKNGQPWIFLLGIQVMNTEMSIEISTEEAIRSFNNSFPSQH